MILMDWANPLMMDTVAPVETTGSPPRLISHATQTFARAKTLQFCFSAWNTPHLLRVLRTLAHILREPLLFRFFNTGAVLRHRCTHNRLSQNSSPQL